MSPMNALADGYRRFHKKYFIEDSTTYRSLSARQAPRIAMIACSDSRVDPAILTDAAPGELFVIRNVANLVPPYQPDTSSYHGTSAAVEFAVTVLHVSHIVVLGHSKCAGIHALVTDGASPVTGISFLTSWMGIAEDVRNDVRHHHGHLSTDMQAQLCEKKVVERSVANLATFPWISERLAKNTLKLHGWHFDLDTGVIDEYHAGGNWAALG